MIQLKNLGKEYITKKKVRTNALQDINLTFEDKGMTFVIGKTGCGKSTLLNLLGKLDEPTTGEIIVNNDNISQYDSQQSDNYRNNYVGFVFQEYNLIDELSVYDNISMVHKIKGDPVDEEEIDKLLAKFELTAQKHKRCDELSGGQRQRVAIIRAIVKKPKLILADEPTGALDSKTGEEIFKILKDLSKQTLVVVVTHDLEYAEQFADRIIEIKDGQVAKDTKPKIKFVHKKDHISNDLKHGSFKFKDLFRLGMSNLGSRWKRLVLMLMVSVLAFSVLGLTFTYYSFDKEKIIVNTMYADNASHFFVLTSQANEYYLTDEGLQNLEKKYKRKFYIVNENLQFEMDENRLNIIPEDGSHFYTEYGDRYISYNTMELNEQIAKDLNVELLCGNYPSNDNEIVVNEYFYIDMLDHDFYGFDNGVLGEYVIEKPEDLIGKQITSSQYCDYPANFTIVGVLDTHFDEQKYEILRQVGIVGGLKENYNYNMLKASKDSTTSFGLNNLMFINEGFYERHLKVEDTSNGEKISRTLPLYTTQSHQDHKVETPMHHGENISTLNYIGSNYDIVWKNGVEKQSLADNEFVLTFNTDNSVSNKKGIYSIVHQGKTLFDHIEDRTGQIYLSETGLAGFPGINYADNDYVKQAVEEIFNTIVFDNYSTFYMDINLTEDIVIGARYEKPMKLVGVAISKEDALDTTGMIVSKNLIDDLTDFYRTGDYYACVTGATTKSADINLLKTITSYDKAYRIQSMYIDGMDRTEQVLGRVAQFTLIGGAVMALFAGLLFYSYISVIIDDKKKQTGILRSLGASKKDIAVLFLIESIFLSLIILVLSSVLTAVLGTVFNNLLINDFGYMFRVLSFGLPSILVILAVTLIISAIATAIPVFRLSKLKPIEALKDN